MLDLIYGRAAHSRRRWYERHPEARRRLSHPVVSVGNLSVGGTGKTPLVAQIAEWLLARGERPAILSRGYKRQHANDGVTVVSDGATHANFAQAGDEPLMLARQLPGAIVCVAEERHLAGVLAERVLGATVHVLDDGFQHVQLVRDFDILVTSPGEIGAGNVLPMGRLREHPTAAAHADFVVVVGATTETARTEAWNLGISAFSGATRRLVLGSITSIGPAVAVAGIGAPEQFVAALRDAGVDLRDSIALPDHHLYTAADVRRIEATRNAAGARAIVTTEKDAVRFAALGKLPFDVIAVPMRLDLSEWNALTVSLEHVLTTARSGV